MYRMWENRENGENVKQREIGKMWKIEKNRKSIEVYNR